MLREERAGREAGGSSQMEKDYDNILNIDYDRPYKIAVVPPETMIYTCGRPERSLAGEWNHRVDVFDSFLRKQFFAEKSEDDQGRPVPVDFSFDQWETMALPCQWNTVEPEYRFYEGTMLFTRTFDYALKESERVFLRIGAANYECRIWLNQKLIARHEGGFTPFCVEVTKHLKAEGNRIILMVNNTRKLDQVPSINYDWYNYGGVFREIGLYSVPRSFVRDFHVFLVPDGKMDRVCVKVKVSGEYAGEACRVRIPSCGIDGEIPIAKTTLSGEAMFSCPGLRLWSPEDPYLHEVTLDYVQDSVGDRIGLREIAVRGEQLCLNGKPLFLRGVCLHEEFGDQGRMFSPEDLERMFADLRDLGANFVRLTHYPHHEAVARAAERHGVMLWEEIPVYWAMEFGNPHTLETARNTMAELVLRDRNRASVILWGIGNENPDSDERLAFFSQVAQTCRALDSTRPLTAACLINTDREEIADRVSSIVDVVGINEYYGWYKRDFDTLGRILKNSKVGKPVIVSETGGEAVCGRRGAKDELYTEDCQAEIYRRQIEIIRQFPWVRGISFWILYDYRTMVRMNSDQQYVNLKGIITRDRKEKKMAFHVLKKFYEECQTKPV